MSWSPQDLDVHGLAWCPKTVSLVTMSGFEAGSRVGDVCKSLARSSELRQCRLYGLL